MNKMKQTTGKGPTLGTGIDALLRNLGAGPTTFKFGDHPDQYLMIMGPEENTPKRSTIVYFLHAGGWMAGRPETFLFIATFFTQMGFPIVLGGYRKAPQSKYPAQAIDVAQGLIKALEELQWDGDIILAGQSAGAQLAAVLALDKELLNAHGLDQDRFRGFISVSGPLDLSSNTEVQFKQTLKAYIGPEDNWDAADPIRMVEDPPDMEILCLHGDMDMLVNVKNSENFIKALGNDAKARLVLVKGAGHFDITAMFEREWEATAITREWLDMLDPPK